MTAPLHAAIAAPLPFERRTTDRQAAVAAHPASGTPGRSRREAILADLLDQAHLFDDPDAYEAGVRDAFERLTATAG